MLYGSLHRAVDLVVWPESEDDCVTLVNLAREHDVCLIPYGGRDERDRRAASAGGGSDGGLARHAAAERDRVDQTARNRTACVRSGILGGRLQELLAEQGFTSGHEPDSMELSTFGGWSRHQRLRNETQPVRQHRGHRRERNRGDTVGVVENLYATPRQSAGVQAYKAAFGSEGNLGLVTKAVLRIHRLPEAKRYGSMIFADWGTGVAFMAALNQTGAKPASIRLVDNVQFRLGQALKPAPTTTEGRCSPASWRSSSSPG